MTGGSLDDFQDLAEELMRLANIRGLTVAMTVVTHANSWSWGNVADRVVTERMKDSLDNLAGFNRGDREA